MRIFNNFKELTELQESAVVRNINTGDAGGDGSCTFDAQALGDKLSGSPLAARTWEVVKQESTTIDVTYGIKDKEPKRTGELNLGTGTFRLENGKVLRLPQSPADFMVSAISQGRRINCVYELEGLLNDFVKDTFDKLDLGDIK